MIKKSIVIKIFLIIIILFSFQTILQTGFQKFFLASYYENEKIADIDSFFLETIEEFKNADTLTEQTDILEDYISKTNEPIAVYNDYFDIHQAAYSLLYKITLLVEDENGETFNLPVDERIDENLYMLLMEDYIVDEKIILYSFLEEGERYPFSFDYNNDIYYLMQEIEEINFKSLGFEVVESNAVIIDFYEILLSDEISNKLSILEEKFFSEVFGESFNADDGGLYEYIIEEVKLDNETYYFTTLISLQPINEILEIQGKFQSYILIIMLLVIAVIAIVMSKLIAKPIVDIASAADSIGRMNFDVKCDEDRSDEIGILAKNINYLSKTLKEKIDDLESLNEQLEGEVIFAKKQEKIRKEFVANVSHELKTPLGVITSYSEGILDGISKEKEKYYLGVINDEVHKMNELIVDMLELSNLETRQMLNPLQSISIRRMISNLIRPYKAEMNNKNILFSINMEECLSDVDVKKMELVFINLISNAIRYVDEKKIINISLFKDKEISIFEIENSYDSIPEDEINKIWDRFYRVEKSRSRLLGGNGLGLAIVKSILDMHGFVFSVKNTEIGVKFKIIFFKQ